MTLDLIWWPSVKEPGRYQNVNVFVEGFQDTPFENLEDAVHKREALRLEEITFASLVDVPQIVGTAPLLSALVLFEAACR